MATPPPTPPPTPSWPRRLAWLALIWAASILALGLVAALLRGLMRLAGMTA